jgi:hypothetical protein
MRELRFDEVIASLRRWQESLAERLRDSATRDGAVQLKRQLDDAIECLELCERYQVRPNAKVIVLPETETRSPSSEFRLIEDHESDRSEHWTEVMLNGARVRPSPGSLIIERR